MSMALQLCCIYFKLNNAVGSKCYLDVDFSSLTQISYSSRSEQNRIEQNRNVICKDLYIYTSSYKTFNTTIYT